MHARLPHALSRSALGIVLDCNIHDWVIAYLYVSESPDCAKTGADGRRY